MKIGKWGGSLAVRLPADLVEVLSLKEGDAIQLVVQQPTASRQVSVRKQLSPADIVREFQAFRGRLPADFKFSRDEANGQC